MSEAGPEQEALGRRLEAETEVREPDAATLAQQRAQAQRRADFLRGGISAEDRAAGEARMNAEFQERSANVGWDGLSDADRAAQEARTMPRPGEVASRLDPEGRAAAPVSGPIDTGAEVHKFTGEAQESPEAAVSEGADGEADRTGGASISERLSGLDRDER